MQWSFSADVRRAHAVLASNCFYPLAVCSVLSLGFLVTRFGFTGSMRYRFLVWNLFLAWVPYGCAVALSWLNEEETRRERRGYTKRFAELAQVALATMWLVTFPNAPYILTDLVHLWRPSGFAFWYDLAMILAFALAGVMAGVASMRVVHRTISSLAGPTLGPILGYVTMIGAAMLSGVGIYVGRVLRWNSWDLIVRPHILLPQFASAALQPWNNRHAVAFSILFGLLFAVIYLLTADVTYEATNLVVNFVRIEHTTRPAPTGLLISKENFDYRRR